MCGGLAKHRLHMVADGFDADAQRLRNRAHADAAGGVLRPVAEKGHHRLLPIENEDLVLA
jgi:urocanate hydratase